MAPLRAGNSGASSTGRCDYRRQLTMSERILQYYDTRPLISPQVLLLSG